MFFPESRYFLMIFDDPDKSIRINTQLVVAHSIDAGESFPGYGLDRCHILQGFVSEYDEGRDALLPGEFRSFISQKLK